MLRTGRRIATMLVWVGLLVIVVTACADGGASSSVLASDELTEGAAGETSTTATSPTTVQQVQPTTETTGTSSLSSSSSGAATPADRQEGAADGCTVVADLEDEDELRRWQIVNDGVMGGRSSAEAEVADSVVSVTGEIVTEGGGFSSIRLALDEPLGEVTRLRFLIRTDGRAYELTAADAGPDRDRRISHQGPISATGTNEAGGWEEVEVDLTSLETSIFGRPVDVAPFRPDQAVEVGIILADGADGAFRFELDRITVCP